MADPSLSRTLVAQVCLCLAFYLALNIGKPRNYDFLKIGDGNPLDFYFISVWGGLRSVKEETLLLKQVKFCVFLFEWFWFWFVLFLVISNGDEQKYGMILLLWLMTDEDLCLICNPFFLSYNFRSIIIIFLVMEISFSCWDSWLFYVHQIHYTKREFRVGLRILSEQELYTFFFFLYI